MANILKPFRNISSNPKHRIISDAICSRISVKYSSKCCGKKLFQNEILIREYFDLWVTFEEGSNLIHNPAFGFCCYTSALTKIPITCLTHAILFFCFDSPGRSPFRNFMLLQTLVTSLMMTSRIRALMHICRFASKFKLINFNIEYFRPMPNFKFRHTTHTRIFATHWLTLVVNYVGL